MATLRVRPSVQLSVRLPVCLPVYRTALDGDAGRRCPVKLDGSLVMTQGLVHQSGAHGAGFARLVAAAGARPVLELMKQQLNNSKTN